MAIVALACFKSVCSAVFPPWPTSLQTAASRFYIPGEEAKLLGLRTVVRTSGFRAFRIRLRECVAEEFPTVDYQKKAITQDSQNKIEAAFATLV